MRVGVQWIAAGLALGGLTATAAVPSNPLHRQPSARRQLIACMTKQMSADRTISYIEATNVCKARIELQNALLASGDAARVRGGLGP